MNDLRTTAQQALEALLDDCLVQVGPHSWERRSDLAITALRAALAEPVQIGSCIACGNRITGQPEHFVVATASDGVSAPEGYSPQQVETLHPQKGGDILSPPLADRIAGILVEDHIALMEENKILRERLAEPVQEPVAWMEPDWLDPDKRNWPSESFTANPVDGWLPVYTAPPQRKPLTEEEILDCWKQAYEPGRREFDNAARMARAIEAAHEIKE